MITASSAAVLWFGGRRLWEQAFWQLPAQDESQDHPGRRLLRQMLLWTALGDEEAGISLLGQRLVYEEGEPLPGVLVRAVPVQSETVTAIKIRESHNPIESVRFTEIDIGGTGVAASMIVKGGAGDECVTVDGS